MKEKYFVNSFFNRLNEESDILIFEYPLLENKFQDKRTARRIDIFAYKNGKTYAFEVKSDEGDNWEGIRQAVYNKNHRIDNSYLVTGKKPTWEQAFAMLDNGVGCMFMQTPSTEPVHVVRI